MARGSRGPVFVAYTLLGALVALLALLLGQQLSRIGGLAEVRWKYPSAVVLLLGCALAAWVGLHLRGARAPALLFSRVGDARAVGRGWVARLALLPAVLRVASLGLLALALMRPQTYRLEALEVEGIDIVLVLDLSRSMEERDLQPNRLDAGQRTLRQFLRRRESDRLGLVVFAREAMLMCPLTLDYRALDQIIADLAIGDVPEVGTAIGDGLGLALATLRRSDARSRVVVLVSDGDSNIANEMDPEEAKRLAMSMGVKVFTILMGREVSAESGSGRYAVDPGLLQRMARDTGGLSFRAGDDAELERSFQVVRQSLEKSRRRVIGMTPDRELFAYFAVPAICFLLLEIGLSLTRWRRFP
jgi:Ca-activated chloride channel family protein